MRKQDYFIWWYLWLVRSWLPCSHKMKRGILKEIRATVYDYVAENPGVSFYGLVDHFGEPQQIAGTYVNELDTDKLLEDLRLRKRILKIVAATACMILLFWGGYVVYSYREHQTQTGGYYVETMEKLSETLDNTGAGEVTGRKLRIYYDADGVQQWQISLTSTFTYTGKDAVCSSAECDVTIYDTSWIEISQNTQEIGALSKGIVVLSNRLLGLEVDRGAMELWMSCTSRGYIN